MIGRLFPKGKRVARMWLLATGTAAAIIGLSGPASADSSYSPVSPFKLFPAIDEVRAGVYAASLEGALRENNKGREKGDAAINGELLFARFRPDFANPLQQFFFNPRLHIGFTYNPSGGPSQGYAGFTWDYHLTDLLFIEGSLGGTVHDGVTDETLSGSLGCPVLFREAAGVGVELTESVRVIATVEHSSNAGLCEKNHGITNAGVRLGYKW